MDLVTGEIGLHATPIVARDVVIVGAAHRGGSVPESKTHVKGYVRGFDVRTGKRRWIFHTIPAFGEFGRDTSEADSASYMLNGKQYLVVAASGGSRGFSRRRWKNSRTRPPHSPHFSSRITLAQPLPRKRT